MKTFVLSAILCLSAVAPAQQVHFDYDRSASFANYRTYQWATRPGGAQSQLMDQNIKRAVDEQLMLKGLRRVEQGGDLQVGYQVAVDKEKQYTGFAMGPRWTGTAQVSSSTIDVGHIVVDMFDPGRQQLVWRGDAEKTLDISKDPEKNYRKLQKAMSKLFKNYPPGAPAN